MRRRAASRRARAVYRREFFTWCVGAALTVATGSGRKAVAATPKPKVVVGSKNFTEQLICGELAAALLEHAGYPVERKLRLGGTAICHEALISGNIDTYVEYTGTGLTAILKLAPEADPTRVYDTVKREYEKRFHATWLAPWGFNDTYALVMRRDRANQLGVRTISDLRGKASGLTLGATQEFLVRPDGLPGLEKTYGITFKAARGMDFGLMYQAVAAGDVDVISAFSTDGRIVSLGLVVLQDDRHYFPPYYAAPVIRLATLRKDPHIADVLNQLAGKISDKTMASLNLLVDQSREDPADVARAFLTHLGVVR